jgi:hypothetical protein
MERTLPHRDADADADLPPELRHYVIKLYREAWTAYIIAGCPFGHSDDSMLIWFEFNQQTRMN